MPTPVTTSAMHEDACRLLAACYYPPTAAFLEENCCDSLATLLAETAPEAARHAADAANLIKNNSLEELAVEHARLFMGPFQLVAPPYGSIYLDDAKTVMGESTARVSAFYRANGLQLADDFHELPDHIAVELEFLSYLAHRQREAGEAGNHGEAERLNGVQQEFLTTYLQPWLEPFTTAVINDGESPFYQAVARCTAAFISADNG
ncbi:MAG: molecular chaperone TorD family protein [Pelobacteraceae bacterium]